MTILIWCLIPKYFQLEEDYDFVEFYSQPNSYSVPIARITGKGSKDDVRSYASYTILRFHTDESVIGRGFNISFLASKEFNE